MSRQKLLVFKSLLTLFTMHTAVAGSLAFDDWHPTADDSYLCHGFYEWPDVEYLGEDISEIAADEIEFAINRTAHLVGDIEFAWQQHRIYADDVWLYHHNNLWSKIESKAPIKYENQEIRVLGQAGTFSREPWYFELVDAEYRYYPHHARGKASLVEIWPKHFTIKNATYTTCAPGKNTWRLHANKIRLYPHWGRAGASNIVLKSHNVPIFYWPYLNYPIDNKRHSGFLFPHYGSNTQSGLSLSLPFYWNIAPNQDAQIALRWLSERGTQVQTRYRYLTHSSVGSLNWHVLPSDRKLQAFQREFRTNIPVGMTQFDPRIRALDKSSTRNGVQWIHDSHFGKYFSANIHFEYVSDDNYFIDLGHDLDASSQIQLPQRVSLGYHGKNWTHHISIEEYQVLQPLTSTINEELYKRQPEWIFNAYYPYFFESASLYLQGDFANFNHSPDPLTGFNKTTGIRTYLFGQVDWHYQYQNFYITPKAGLHWRYYKLQRGDDDLLSARELDSFIPELTIDSGINFKRMFSFGGNNWIQTLSPRIYYVYIPYKNQNDYPNFDSGIVTFQYDQLFRANRFLGFDRIGDTDQVTVSLQSEIYSPTFSNDVFKIQLGQIFYFNNRLQQICDYSLGTRKCFPELNQLDDKHSNFIFAADWSNIAYHAGFWSEWDTSNGKIEQTAMYLHYWPDWAKFNLYYYWQREDITPQPDLATFKSHLNQVDLSMFVPINNHWQILARVLTDIKYSEFAEVLFGVEYNSCCFGLQLVGNRYRQPNNLSSPVEYANGVFLQIAFKGLSTMGLNQADEQLKKKIPGYEAFSERVRKRHLG